MSLAQVLQELPCLVVEPWENLIERMITQVAIDRFAQHAAEVCGYSEVAALVELGLVEAGPASVDLAAFDRAAHHEHHVGVAVVGAAVAVLPRGAAEFRHRDNDRIFGQVAEVDPEGARDCENSRKTFAIWPCVLPSLT